MDTELVVKGFGSSLHKLNGQYVKTSVNCGRPMYKKVGRKGKGNSCIYFWDANDGMKGWWFSPKVNGDDVWARHPSLSKLPPRQGWFAPWDSKVADKNVIVSLVTTDVSSHGAHGLKRLSSFCDTPAKKLKSEEKLEGLIDSIAETLNTVKTCIPPCVNLLDKLKDYAVTFECEVIDHMPPNDVLETKAKADATGKEAQEEIAKMRKLCDTARTQNERCRNHEHAETKAALDAFSKQFHEMSRDVSKHLANVARGSQKAMHAKRQEQVIAAQRTQLVSAQKLIAFQIISKPIAAALPDAGSIQELRDAESLILAMMEVVKKEAPHAQSSAHSFRQTSANLKTLLKQIHKKRKDLYLAEAAKVDEFGILLVRGIQNYMEKEKMDEDAIFAHIAQNESALTCAHMEAFVENLDLGEHAKAFLTTLFSRALTASGQEKQTLSKDEFFMLVASALYSTCSDTVLDDGKDTYKVESGDIVEVIDGPVDEPLKVRCKLMDGVTGWMPFKVLRRMSPHFSVVHNTVLTDRHELKDFRVITRVSPGMKLLAEKRPEVDPTTKLLRMPVQLILEAENVHGFVTVKGNRGARLLKQDMIASCQGGMVSPREMTDDDWARLVSESTSSVMTDLLSSIQEITDLKADCERKCVTLEALADGWAPDVLEETSEAAVAAYTKVDSLIQALVCKLGTQTSEFRNVSSELDGPLREVKSTVEDVQQRLAVATSAHQECTKRARILNKKLMQDLALQKKKADLAVEEELVNTRINDMIGRKELVLGMQSRLETVVEDDDGLATLEELVASAGEMITSNRRWIEEIRQECQSKIAKKAEFSKNCGELSLFISKLHKLMLSRKARLSSLRSNLVEKGAILVAKALRDHMDQAKLSETDLFAQLTKESGVIKVPALQDWLSTQKIDVSTFTLEQLFQRLAFKDSSEISRCEFSFLTKPHYNVVKAGVFTDVSDKVSRLTIDDTVVVLGPIEDNKNGEVRVHVSYGEKEGYLTGKEGLLEPQTLYYRVAKETLLTNKFEMQDFQPVRRLKIGDILRARSPPLIEKGSNLCRVEVIALFPKDVARSMSRSENSGFATIKSPQGTYFLKSVSIDAGALEEPGPVDVA